MNDTHDDANEPRWLRLAAGVSARPEPATLAHVRARLAARARGPAWVRWLARPATLAASAALLVASAFVGSAVLSVHASTPDDESSVMSTLLGDDGSYGLAIDRDASVGAADADSPGDSL